MMGVEASGIAALRPRLAGDDVDVAETRGAGGVRHPAGLAGLALAAGDEAVAAAVRLIRDGVARVPELGRDAGVDHVAQHVRAPAVFDQPECVAAELEVVALLIDAERAVALDVDA